MPIVTIQITREGVTPKQKQALIRGATDLLVKTLNKDPQTTFVVIEQTDTDDWGVGGENVTSLRRRQRASATVVQS